MALFWTISKTTPNEYLSDADTPTLSVSDEKKKLDRSGSSAVDADFWNVFTAKLSSMKPRPTDYRARMAQNRALEQNAARHNAPILQHQRKQVLRDELQRLQVKLDTLAPTLRDRRTALTPLLKHCADLIAIEDEGQFARALAASPYFKKKGLEPLAAAELKKTVEVLKEADLALGQVANLAYQTVNTTRKVYEKYGELVNFVFSKALELLFDVSVDLPSADDITQLTTIFARGSFAQKKLKLLELNEALGKAVHQDMFQIERAVAEAQRTVNSFRLRHGVF